LGSEAEEEDRHPDSERRGEKGEGNRCRGRTEEGKRIVGRRPMRSVSTPATGPAMTLPAPNNETTRPTLDGENPRAVRKNARNGKTKLASAEMSQPVQSHQKVEGSPPRRAARERDSGVGAFSIS